MAGLEAVAEPRLQLRSRALHAGDQIPIELLIPPEPYGGVPCERRPDHLAESRDYEHRAIVDEEFPMHLHIFEHIAQGCLVAWWRSLSA